MCWGECGTEPVWTAGQMAGPTWELPLTARRELTLADCFWPQHDPHINKILKVKKTIRAAYYLTINDLGGFFFWY